MDFTEGVTMRTIGDIPYMKIDELYNKLYFTGAEKYPDKAKQTEATHNGSEFEAPAYEGTKATFGTDADTFACDNLDAYTAAPYYTLFLVGQADPAAPFVCVSGIDRTGDVTPRTVDLKKYGIDLAAEGDDLWVPLPTLECIFCCTYAYDVFYNGQGIYMSDGAEVLQATNARGKESSAGLAGVLNKMIDEKSVAGESMKYADGKGYAIYMEQGDTAMYVLTANHDNVNFDGAFDEKDNERRFERDPGHSRGGGILVQAVHPLQAYGQEQPGSRPRPRARLCAHAGEIWIAPVRARGRAGSMAQCPEQTLCFFASRELLVI